MTVLALPPDDALVEALRHEADSLGWTLDVSRGSEQVIVSVVDGGDPVELAASLPFRDAIDVVPLESRERYARKRWRRRLLTAMVAGLAVLTAVGWAIPITGFLTPPREPLSTPRLFRLVNAEQMPENSAKRFRVHEKPVLLVHGTEGRYHAVSGRCTFMGNCQLEWEQERRQIVCPCHGCTFDVYGNVVEGPPSIPLATYAVEHHGEHVYLRREG